MASSDLTKRAPRAALPVVRLKLILFCMVVLMSACSSHASDKVLVVGKSRNAFTGALGRFRVNIVAVDKCSQLDLADFSAVVICAPDRKTPQTIPDSLKDKLQAYVKNGGRGACRV